MISPRFFSKKRDGMIENMVSLEYETKALSAGYSRIIGIDEAGRGPLAGPVVAAACLLPAGIDTTGITDSKKLTPDRRAALFERLTCEAEWEVGVVDAAEIDEINILQATLLAMGRAAAAVEGDYSLIDGNQMPPLDMPGETIVKGDSRSLSIAAASIIAKEYRDRLMLDYHDKWPYYRFDTHKGYGTQLHRLLILEHGPCPIHRKSFLRNTVSGERGVRRAQSRSSRHL